MKKPPPSLISENQLSLEAVLHKGVQFLSYQKGDVGYVHHTHRPRCQRTRAESEANGWGWGEGLKEAAQSLSDYTVHDISR